MRRDLQSLDHTHFDIHTDLMHAALTGGMHRDAKIYDIFEGTEQIQQMVVARAISGLRIE